MVEYPSSQIWPVGRERSGGDRPVEVTPYAMVRRAKAFVAFVTHAFEAEVANVVPFPADPERVRHAEARIGAGVRFFADAAFARRYSVGHRRYGPGGRQQHGRLRRPFSTLWCSQPGSDTPV